MKKLAPYAIAGRLVLAFALFIASSGFTVVLHSCLMENQACCDRMSAAGAMPPETGAGRVSRGATPCCENVVVGGLNRTVATIDQQALLHLKTLAGVQASIVTADPAVDAPAFFSFCRSRAPDPPPLGLYISNASLLI